MAEYKLVFDKEFNRKFRKLDRSLQIQGEKKIKRLKINPRGIGKPLKYLANLYELHLESYRIFYVVQDFEIRILFLSVEHKDECDKYLRQLTSDKIRLLSLENS